MDTAPPAWVADADGNATLELPLLHLRARVEEGALLVRPTEGFSSFSFGPQKDFTLRLRTCSFGYEGLLDQGQGCAWQLSQVDGGATQITPKRVEIAHEGFSEWFEAEGSGIHHGWTIGAPPAGWDGMSPLLIGLSFEGLSAQLSEDGQLATLVDERAQQELFYRGVKAWDASHTGLPTKLIARPGGVFVRIEASRAGFPLIVDPVLGTYAWSFEPNVAGAHLDNAAQGDFNGDGFSDLVVAAQSFDLTPGGQEGHVWLFLGSPSGLGASPTWESSGPAQPGARFGASICGLGDLDGDGLDDFAVAASGYDHPETDEGGFFIYRGSATGSPVQHWQTESDVPSSFRNELFPAGDVNKDGRADILIMHSHPSLGTVVNLYLGSSSPTLPPPATVVAAGTVSVSTAEFQYANACGVGDVDADGYDDVMIGAIYVGGNDGRAWLFRGSASGTLVGPVWTGGPPTLGGSSWYGMRVSPAGDVDANGYADVLVNAASYFNNGVGAIFLYLSNPTANPSTILPPAASQTLFGDHPYAYLGGNFPPLLPGDMDGDGFADVVAPEPQFQTNNGKVSFYRGSASGMDLSSPIVLTTPQAGSYWGTNVCTAGDVNGDGRSDVFITAYAYSGGQSGEGAIFVYHGQPFDTVAYTPVNGSTGTTGSSTSHQGASVALNGDVNGDGYSDLLVGSPLHDGGQTDEGRVQLFLGGPGGTATSAVWTQESNLANAQFGTSAAFAGDVDNDGYCDVLVGAPGYTGGQSSEGRVYLWRGNASGVLGTTPAFTFESNEALARLGTSVSAAGDINGDGLADVICGAPGDHLGQTDRGVVYALTGSGAAPYLVNQVSLNDGAAGHKYGWAVAAAGDVNRDGFGDVVVGAPEYTNIQSLEGRVYVYLGTGSGISTSPVWADERNVTGANLGKSISTAGDVNNDGFADIVVGAPGYQDATNGGAAFVYRGQAGLAGLTAPTQLALNPVQAGAHFGSAVALAGDMNGDGFSDVAVGAELFDGGSNDCGGWWIFLGASSGTITSAAQGTIGTGFNSNAGSALGGAGDADGDGFSELVAGAPGSGGGFGGATIQTGGTPSGGIYNYQQRRSSDLFVIAHLCNSDSTSSLKVGSGFGNHLGIPSTVAGREDVRLEWETKAIAVAAPLLDGSGLVRGASWQDTGPVTGTPPPIHESVAGLSSSERYTWRVRVANRNPLFPHSRWLQLQANGKNEKKFGTGLDCNGNGTPDEVDIALGAPDCNGNAIPDSCDIASTLSSDCDNSAVPDECELDPLTDCDGNLVLDTCDLAPGGGGLDCNGNSVLDECDIASGFSLDTNLDGVPDECGPQVTLYCFGDGSGTACPCGNSSTPGSQSGCKNSFSDGTYASVGARIRATGIASLAADTFTLVGDKMTPSATALYIQGQNWVNAGFGNANGDGLICAGTSLKRLGPKTNSGGASQWGPGAGDIPIHLRSAALGDNILAGTKRYYASYYRNPTAYCTASTYNFTNGLYVTWAP